jgi:hypothetical protein
MTAEEQIQYVIEQIRKGLKEAAPIGTSKDCVNTEVLARQLEKCYQRMFSGHPKEDIKCTGVVKDDEGLYHFTTSLRGVPRKIYRLVPKTEKARQALKELFEELAENED